MQDLLTDPWFYAACIPAVLLVGLSKGGLGGATALIGVPMMTLVLAPVQAAAIMLPILILMDMVSLWTWRGYRHTQTLFYMLPGAMVGIAIGWWLAAAVSTDMVKLIIGLIAALFAGRWFWLKLRKASPEKPPSRARGAFWGMVSGYTSFVAHAGGPPFQMYALPLGLHPREFALVWRLADTPEVPVDKETLLKEVWGLRHVPETNSLAVHVSRLRDKMRGAGLPELVRTTPSGGYVLDLPPRSPAPCAPAPLTRDSPMNGKIAFGNSGLTRGQLQ